MMKEEKTVCCFGMQHLRTTKITMDATLCHFLYGVFMPVHYKVP
jgi:hypothetical protein